MKNSLARTIATAGFLASTGLLSYTLMPLDSSKIHESVANQSVISLDLLSSTQEQSIPDSCNQVPATLESLFNCHETSTLQLYSDISNLPAEFIAAQIFEESTFDSYRGQGAGFGRAQLQHDPFIDTMHAILQRPDLSGINKGLNQTTVNKQRAYQISQASQFQDQSLTPYLTEIQAVIDSSFSITDYQNQTAKNISDYTTLNHQFQSLTTQGINPWFTNRTQIKTNKQQRRQIVKEQKALNIQLDLVLESFWDDYVSWLRNEATNIKTKSGDHLWYSMEAADLPADYQRITDILGAFNMRRVYSDAWTNNSTNPNSLILKEAIIAYRIGENAKSNKIKETMNYTNAVLDNYSTLLFSQ